MELPEQRPGSLFELPEDEMYLDTSADLVAVISCPPDRSFEIAALRETLRGHVRHMTAAALGRLGLTSSIKTTTDLSMSPVGIQEGRTSLPGKLLNRIRRNYETVFPFHLREATREDIPAMVDVDLVAFRSVYKNYDMAPEELREDLLAKFTGRFDKIGGQWSEMLFSRDERPLGFITACPTSKPPEDFKSWEDTTDDGTLETTYDPGGRYLYVVSLSVLPEGSNSKGQDMLMTNMIGRIIAGDYQAYFESRLPGLKKWVLARCRDEKRSLSSLNIAERDNYAQTYFESTTEKDGKKVPLDPLMRMYESMGCSFIKLAPDAYKDELSLDYGVVCQFDNPLPDRLRHRPLARKAIGMAVRAASHSPRIMERI